MYITNKTREILTTVGPILTRVVSYIVFVIADIGMKNGYSKEEELRLSMPMAVFNPGSIEASKVEWWGEQIQNLMDIRERYRGAPEEWHISYSLRSIEFFVDDELCTVWSVSEERFTEISENVLSELLKKRS